MKKLKIAGVILTSFFSIAAFADGSTGLNFDLSNKDQPDAQGDNSFFSCNMKKDNSTLISPTKITFTLDGNGINFKNGNKMIENLSKSDLEEDYFGVQKDQRGESALSYSTNNGSELDCVKGKGGHNTEYTGK